MKPTMIFVILIVFMIMSASSSCQERDLVSENEGVVEDPIADSKNYKLPNIDLNHWKVTLPIGKPTEVEPPAILDYGNNEVLKPFFYNDSIDGSLVFYTFPNSSTTNSSYSRTELREQMVPGDNNTNWTFKQGGTMKGTLAMDEISKDANGKYHRVMVMQIHGRLTNEQKKQIGAKDNNAPPMLKIYWDKGYVRVRTKVLKDKNASDTEILHTSAWVDDQGYNFPDYVGFDKFTMEIIVEEGKMTVVMNDKDYMIYNNENITRWGIFENYFKAGNYLQTTDEDAFAKVKYYELTVDH